MTEALTALISAGVLALAIWYLRSRARVAETQVAALEAAVGALKSVNTELRAALERAVAATAARHDREAEADAATADAARTDPKRAAELLNQLGTTRTP